MTLWTKFLATGSIVILLWMSIKPCQAQDIFDARHGQQYANHLLAAKDYVDAAREYKRLVELGDSNDSIFVKGMACYRMAGLYDSAADFASRYYGALSSMSNAIKTEFTEDLIAGGHYKVAELLLQNDMPNIKQRRLQFFNASLSGDWPQARTLYGQRDFELPKAWGSLILKQQNLVYKKPGLALALSAIVPGAGKVYTGDWKDGIMSALVIGSMGYESYVGFHARGTRSVLGWVFGGLALCFYGGNVYGSYTSAIRYNTRLDNEIHDKAEKLFVAGL